MKRLKTTETTWKAWFRDCEERGLTVDAAVRLYRERFGDDGADIAANVYRDIGRPVVAARE